MSPVLDILLQKGGGFGVLSAILLFGLYRVYSDWQREREAYKLAMAEAQAARDREHEGRLADQRAFTAALLEQSDKAHQAVRALQEVLESTTGTTRPRLPSANFRRP